MNERIREIAEKAKKYALDAMIKITDKEQAIRVYSESYDTKFAELIVQECIDEFIGQLWNYGIDESNNPSFYKAVDRVKESFGVE